MTTISQLIKYKYNKRILKNKKLKNKAFKLSPMRKGICIKVFTMTPKKPNAIEPIICPNPQNKTTLQVLALDQLFALAIATKGR